MFVPVFVTVMVTPGSAAPVVSLTMPLTSPRKSWARTGREKRRKARTTSTAEIPNRCFMTSPPRVRSDFCLGVVADVLYDHIDSRVKALYDHFAKVHNDAGPSPPNRSSPLSPLFSTRFPHDVVPVCPSSPSNKRQARAGEISRTGHTN